MKFRIDRDTLADAVAWTARSLPARPTAPVLGGMLHEVDGGTLPMLTGVRLEIEGEQLRLAATDRYRLAVRELLWKPEQADMSVQVLVPARTIAESAKTLAGGSDVTLALSDGGAGEGMIGF